MDVRFIVLAAVMQMGSGAPVAASPLGYTLGKAYKYNYISKTNLNEALSLEKTENSSPSYNDVGFEFIGTVELTPVWQKAGLMLVKLEISNPQLNSVARQNHSKDLKGLPRLPVFFTWENGKIGQVYSADDDATLAVNIKKGVISMFQIKKDSTTLTQLDASGECKTTYSASGNSIIKTKTGCKSADVMGQFYNVNPLLSTSDSRSSATKYQLKDDIIISGHTEELFVSKVNLQSDLTTTVSVSQELLYKSSGKGTQIQGNSLEDVIKKIEQNSGEQFLHTLPETIFEIKQCTKDCSTFSDLVRESRAKLTSELVATTEAASVFVSVVQACRQTSKQDLLTALQDYSNQDIVPQLLDVLSACQTVAAQEAAFEFLNFEDEYNIDLAERYILGVAFSTHPGEHLLKAFWELYRKDVPNEKLRESIGEGLGALVNTFGRIGDNKNHKLVQDIIASILIKLEGCSSSACQAEIIRALSNAGSPETIPVLLEHAEKSKDAVVSEAAVKALQRMGSDNLQTQEVREAMKRIFHQRSQGFDTAVRSKAFSVLVESGLSQDEISEILDESTDPWNTEYDSYIQARLDNLAQRDSDIKRKLKNAMKNVNVSNYDVMSPKGKALAFTSPLANLKDLTAEYYMYVENSKAGILKRSGMDVTATSPTQSMPLYSFGIFAAGLESLLGEEVEAGQEDVEATAGISLDLLGVSLRPISFFTGQSGLMSAVWNAPSEPVSALQTNLLLQDHSKRLHLSNGLIVEHQLMGAISLDLSGSLSVSLWNKNAKCLIKNSAAVVMTGKTNIITSSFRTGIDFDASSLSRIDFQSDVDFYDGIKSCLQMGRPNVTFKHNVSKFESARGFKKSFRANIRRTHSSDAVSYPLPPRNNQECRKLMATNS